MEDLKRDVVVDKMSQGFRSPGKSQFKHPPARPSSHHRSAATKRQFVRPLPQVRPHKDVSYEHLEPQRNSAAQPPALPASPGPAVQLRQPANKWAPGKRLRRLSSICSILTIVIVVFMGLANGATGAWGADFLRALVGPTLTAQIESWYLRISDKTYQVQYSLSGRHVDPPWALSTPLVTATAPPRKAVYMPIPLNHLTPIIRPALPGEGAWLTQGMAPAPYAYVPLDAKTFIRPDPSHPYAIVTLVQFDTRFCRLHIVAGTTEPGGARGLNGPGVIPAADQQENALLAAFNGGFKFADGRYGLKTNGIVYVPPQLDAATIALTKNGQIILGSWGVDARLNSGNTDLIAWRQNAALLINNGVINPLTQDGAAWGGTILNRSYTWRSAIGLTAHGSLIYAAGDFLTALTLGQALRAAGAVLAMQMDINPFWVRAFMYNRNARGNLSISKLNPAMYGTGTEYLYGTQRDFFYMTRFVPSPPAQPLPHAHEVGLQ